MRGHYPISAGTACARLDLLRVRSNGLKRQRRLSKSDCAEIEETRRSVTVKAPKVRLARHGFRENNALCGVPLLVITLILAAVRLPAVQPPSSVNLIWDPSPSPTIVGYDVEYGTSSGNYTSVQDAGDNTNATVSSLSPGVTYYFTVVGYTADSEVTPPSNELIYTAPGGTNQPPAVEAGPNQIIVLPATANLQGSVSDDGLPNPPGMVTTLWSVVSGPGQVVFEDATAPATTAAFPAPGIYVLQLSASDGQLASSNDIMITVGASSVTNTALAFEAESGTLTTPMTAKTNTSGTSTTVYIMSSQANKGTASYSMNVPTGGNYVVWCRVTATNSSSESFIVSMDGGPQDIFDAVLTGNYSSSWVWSVVNGRGGTNAPASAAGTINPRIFPLTAGSHTLLIQARQKNTLLDKLLVTDDLSFVPVDPTGTDAAPVLNQLTMPPNGPAVSWPTIPGRLYSILYKTNLTDSVWNTAASSLPASGTSLQWVDGTSPIQGQRFYRIILLP